MDGGIWDLASTDIYIAGSRQRERERKWVGGGGYYCSVWPDIQKAGSCHNDFVTHPGPSKWTFESNGTPDEKTPLWRNPLICVIGPLKIVRPALLLGNLFLILGWSLSVSVSGLLLLGGSISCSVTFFYCAKLKINMCVHWFKAFINVFHMHCSTGGLC